MTWPVLSQLPRRPGTRLKFTRRGLFVQRPTLRRCGKQIYKASFAVLFWPLAVKRRVVPPVLGARK